jgi:outer membrane usher protein
MGGAQVQRNFSLRPNLITMPLPDFTGSAVVPSNIDVYVNNVKTYSQQVEAGPYHIENLPVITGSGSARVVVTDSTGRQTEQEQQFFTSPDLLRRGLYDYSLDVGVARLDYGTESFAYDGTPLALASFRYGITDWLTGELHGESDATLMNAGFGIVAGLGSLGEVTAALAASEGDNGFGGLFFGGWESQFGRINFSASTRRKFGNYDDLASATAETGSISVIGTDPRAVDQLSLSYGFPIFQASAGLGLVHLQTEKGDHTVIASGTLTKSFANNLSLYASGFWETASEGEYGVYAGLSYTFGNSLSASSNASLSEGSVTAVASLAKSRDGDPGSYGWRVSKGVGGIPFTAADADYQSTKGLFQAKAFQQGTGASIGMALDGAVVAAGGGVFLGNRIDEAFAVVDVGAGNVPVQLENRAVGATASNGKLLVTGLKAYENNKISIEIANLPVMADIPKTETMVVPRENSGVTIDFGIKTRNAAAIVIVTDEGGKVLPVGSTITVKGQGEPFLVGFDGQVYVSGLAERNEFESTVNSVACYGSFEFNPAKDEQQTIGPVKCS